VSIAYNERLLISRSAFNWRAITWQLITPDCSIKG
jgi:hypothetical protein